MDCEEHEKNKTYFLPLLEKLLTNNKGITSYPPCRLANKRRMKILVVYILVTVCFYVAMRGDKLL